MSKYTKTVAATPEAERANISKSLKTSINKHTGFGNIKDHSKSLPIDTNEAAGYSPEVVALAGQLKYQGEQDFTPSGGQNQKFSDAFYLQYAQRQINMSFNGHYDKVLGGLDVAPDPKYAQYSYEEIIAMANNGVNIPKAVLGWAKGQQEADVTDYVIVSDVKSKKAQEDIIKKSEKTNEYAGKASDISKKQKNILNQSSIDKTEKMVNEWKELDKKKKEGTITSSEYAEYTKLSKKLDKNSDIIKQMQNDAVQLDDFLDSIDDLQNKTTEGRNIAGSTINAAANLSNLDDGLNIFHRAHAYKMASTTSSSLADRLSGINDIQLSLVAEKIGHDLENISNEANVIINSDTTKEIISFADEYTHTAEHIENVLDIESFSTDKTEVKDTDEQNENKDEVSKNKNQNETTSTKTDNQTQTNILAEITSDQKDITLNNKNSSESESTEMKNGTDITNTQNISDENKNTKESAENEIINNTEIETEENKENTDSPKSVIQEEEKTNNVVNNDTNTISEDNIDNTINNDTNSISEESTDAVVNSNTNTISENNIDDAINNNVTVLTEDDNNTNNTILNNNQTNNTNSDSNLNEEDTTNVDTAKINSAIPGVNTELEPQNIAEPDANTQDIIPENENFVSNQNSEQEINENETIINSDTDDNETSETTNRQTDTNTEDLKEYVVQNIVQGRQPEDLISSYNGTHKFEVTETKKTSKSDNSTSNTEKTNKTEKNNQKEEIVDHQASLKDEYGNNFDFVKLVVANNIVSLIGLGPASFTFAILKWAAIVGLSILDLYSKKGIVDESGELADKDAKSAEDASKALTTKANQIKAEHDKNFAQSKIYTQQLKELQNAAIDYQFAMYQNQIKLVQSGKMKEEDIVEYEDPTAGAKSVIRKQVSLMAQKDEKLLSSIEEPKSKVLKTMKESNLSSKGFNDLNTKLTERNDNNDAVGDVIIAETIVAQGIITALIAILMAGGPWCWPLAALWAKTLIQNAAVAATGVAAKLVSDNVEHKIDDNNKQLQDQSKSRIEQQKNMSKAEKNIAKAKLDKMDNLPAEKEAHIISDEEKQNSGENTLNQDQNNNQENINNNSFNNTAYIPQPSTKDISTGFNQSSLNAELNGNNPNDVAMANEYAKVYAKQVNQSDEKSRSAAAIANTDASTKFDTTDKSDVKLARFNKDGAIDSKRRSQKVNAASSAQNGRKRR